MLQTTMKTKGRQLQRACKTKYLSSEGTVRARSEILTLWAALKQLSENINDEGIVLLRLVKKKISYGTFLLPKLAPHLTELSKVFQAECFDFAQVKASVERCITKVSLIPLLNPRLKLLAKILIVNYIHLERRMVWLTHVCQVAWRFGRSPKEWQSDRSHTQKGDRSE